MSQEAQAETLARNLRALAERGSRLALRLTWPMRSSHVTGIGTCAPRRKGVSLALEPAALAAQVEQGRAAHARAKGERALVLLGIGSGDLLLALLERLEIDRIAAWDRDPWLVRSLLSRADLASEIRAGRLELAVGADVVALGERFPQEQMLWHPHMAGIYRIERELLQRGPGGRRAAIAVDRLFADDLARELSRRGFAPCGIDLESWSREELDYALSLLRPDRVWSINYTHGLAEFCEERETPLVVWEVDPTTERLSPLAAPAPHTTIFTYRQAHVATFRDAGFERVSFLPLATDPEKRRPLALSTAERERFGSRAAFVGSSLEPEARRAMRILAKEYFAWHPAGAGAAAELEERLASVLDRQAEDFATYRIPELVQHALGDFIASREWPTEDPVRLVDQLAACAKRRSYVEALAPLDVSVWGDPGWRESEARGVRYRGFGGHHHELTRIYNGAALNVDVGRIYQSDIATMRTFDVLACGGFLLAEHSRDLEALFEIGRELETYRTRDELVAKAEFFLANPDRASEIAARGREAVQSRHTLEQRVDAMCSLTGPSCAGGLPRG